MKSKDKLYYLIKEYMVGHYDIETFCDLFSQTYNIEVDYKELSDTENTLFDQLSTMAARFSNNEEDLRLPNVYFDEEAINKKVAEVAGRLGL